MIRLKMPIVATAATTRAFREGWAAYLKGDVFDARVVSKLQIKSACLGKVECAMEVEKHHLNNGRKLHGGVLCSLVDVAGSLSIATHGLYPNTGVSTDISVSFVSGAAENETLNITAECVRLGRTLAFTDVVVRATAEAGSGGEGRLVGMGKHTKFVAKAHEEAVAPAADDARTKT